MNFVTRARPAGAVDGRRPTRPGRSPAGPGPEDLQDDGRAAGRARDDDAAGVPLVP